MHQYSRRFRVRHYELDSFGHLNNAVYVNYMQEAAIEASADAGFGPAWYAERGTGWVIRQLSIRYYLPVIYGDELEVKTWISEARRVSTTREYQITRTRDRARAARARVNWIYLDLNRGQPTRLPAELAGAFEPTGELEDLGIRLQNPSPTGEAFRYRTRRRVQTYELDTARHVNHAVYLNWVEQAYFDALRAAGHAVERTRGEGWLALQGGHDIQYLEPAFDADEIEITSWVCELGRVRGAWTHEIRCADRDRLLAREYSLGIFVDPEGKPRQPPRRMIEDVLRGGPSARNERIL
ncbi:MAG TPA: thioesterase family protein [Pyrinomonadaceae bacterium]|jgi:acyl-CoA thioester hydrolase|nr:thioesterase family protein [Pyrinomonadaceae bacterium]